MKKRLFAFLMIALAVSGLYAQDVPEKTKIYRTWISLNSEPYKIKGILYQISNSSVFVSNFKIPNYSANSYEAVELHIENIMKIKTRKINRVEKGAIIGAITGFAVGGLIGYALDDDYLFSRGEQALMLGIPSAIVCLSLGALIGSAKIVIHINGSASGFNYNKNKLREYSIIK